MKRRQVLKNTAAAMAALAASLGYPVLLIPIGNDSTPRLRSAAVGLKVCPVRSTAMGQPPMNWVIFATRIGLTATVYFMLTAWVLTVFRIRRDTSRRINAWLSAKRGARSSVLSTL